MFSFVCSFCFTLHRGKGSTRSRRGQWRTLVDLVLDIIKSIVHWILFIIACLLFSTHRLVVILQIHLDLFSNVFVRLILFGCLLLLHLLILILLI